jgi:hypothetical protein
MSGSWKLQKAVPNERLNIERVRALQYLRLPDRCRSVVHARLTDFPGT